MHCAITILIRVRAATCNRIGARDPSAQVDITAPGRTEWADRLLRWRPADRAARHADPGRGAGGLIGNVVRLGHKRLKWDRAGQHAAS
jgi:hypothetical protein